MIRFERCAGNEIFEVDVERTPQAAHVNGAIAELDYSRADYGFAVPDGSWRVVVRFWKHYGPRAFDLRLVVVLSPPPQPRAAHIRSSGDVPGELVDPIRRALNTTVSWPIDAEVSLQLQEPCLLFRISQHAEQIALLMHVALSQVRYVQAKPGQSAK